MISKNMHECYYFGCIGEPGHYWFDPYGKISYGSQVERLAGSNIWPRIDGGFCPGATDRAKPYARSKPEVEGEALLHHIDGWTILAFWDRSVDKRGACNSNFIVRGEHTFEQVLDLARVLFPQVMGRLKFEIKLEVK